MVFHSQTRPFQTARGQLDQRPPCSSLSQPPFFRKQMHLITTAAFFSPTSTLFLFLASPSGAAAVHYGLHSIIPKIAASITSDTATGRCAERSAAAQGGFAFMLFPVYYASSPHQQAFISNGANLIFQAFLGGFQKRPRRPVRARRLVVFISVDKEACCATFLFKKRGGKKKTWTVCRAVIEVCFGLLALHWTS